MFQTVYEYFKKTANSNHILVRESEAMSDESTKPPAASNYSLAPVLNNFSCKLQETLMDVV